MRKKLLMVLAVVLPVLFIIPNLVYAHCDTMEGPVITDAKKALDAGDVNLVLIWVQKQDEQEIRQAFQKALAVRKLSPEAKELADRYFFETLVRVHRAGEGAPFTGLKSAKEADLGPAVVAADKAIETGSSDALLKLTSDAVQDGIKMRFKEVMAKKNYKKEDVAAGRNYVKAYVEFVHYVERVYDDAKGAAGEEHEHHAAEPSEHSHQHK